MLLLLLLLLGTDFYSAAVSYDTDTLTVRYAETKKRSEQQRLCFLKVGIEPLSLS